jgi:hypothetical protein
MPNPAPHKLKQSLEVLVFQDGLASRNFTIPLSWFSRLGWIVGSCLLATALATGGALWIWRQSHEAQPERLKELENQIQALEGKLAAKPEPAPVAVPVPAPPAPVTATAPVPAPTVTVTVTAPAPESPETKKSSAAEALSALKLFKSQAGSPRGGAMVGFSAFPDTVVGEIPWVARPSVPIEMTMPQLQWQGRKLKVKFDIRYVGPEGKSQQGRIIVVARGPETLIVYPSGALRAAEGDSLFDVDQGEYFSVSRFRETRLELPSVDSPLRSLEIFLIGTDSIDEKNKILIHETYPVPPTGGVSRAADPENP